MVVVALIFLVASGGSDKGLVIKERRTKVSRALPCGDAERCGSLRRLIRCATVPLEFRAPTSGPTA